MDFINVDTAPEASNIADQLTKTAHIVFDPHGDVTLVLSTPSGKAYFQINSVVLCLASPVFQAMLGIHSSFKEGRELATRRSSPGTPPVEITLADDEPHVLAVILRILHQQHDYVPTSLPPERLYQLAILCDKYDMRASLTLWLEKWGYFSSGGPELSIDKWLFMSYAFMDAQKFKYWAGGTIINTRLEDENLQVECPLRGWSCPITFDSYVPQPVFDEILAMRQQTLEIMIDTTHKLIETYMTPPLQVKCRHANETCDAIVLGILIRYLRDLNLYPDASRVMNRSVVEVGRLISRLTYPPNILLDMPVKIEACCDHPIPCACHKDCCWYCSSSGCQNCGKIYQVSFISMPLNHSRCLPLESFQREMNDIVRNAMNRGLDYSRFARNRTGNSKPESAPKPADLWFCLEYK